MSFLRQMPHSHARAQLGIIVDTGALLAFKPLIQLHKLHAAGQKIRDRAVLLVRRREDHTLHLPGIKLL